MTSTEFQERLAGRARTAGVGFSGDVGERLEVYFRLLARWSAKVNLTALPLSPPSDETLDRLLIEPLAAARHADASRVWYDVGSGGGSPAIPFRIARPSGELTMTESRERKAAFLREAVRVIGLVRTAVENDRFESVAANTPGVADLVTVRAVRCDSGLFSAIGNLLSPGGRVFLFHSKPELEVPATFATLETARLGTAAGARLTILEPLLRGGEG